MNALTIRKFEHVNGVDGWDLADYTCYYIVDDNKEALPKNGSHCEEVSIGPFTSAKIAKMFLQYQAEVICEEEDDN
tara:strand:+ start:913 stop:1140 length:228 start_codon:yes stop_codon:yes gene_type:complete